MPFKAPSARVPGTTRVRIAPYTRNVPKHYMHHNKPRPRKYWLCRAGGRLRKWAVCPGILIDQWIWNGLHSHQVNDWVNITRLIGKPGWTGRIWIVRSGSDTFSLFLFLVASDIVSWFGSFAILGALVRGVFAHCNLMIALQHQTLNIWKIFILVIDVENIRNVYIVIIQNYNTW